MAGKKNEDKKIGTIIRRYMMVVLTVAFIVLFLGVMVVQGIYQRVYYYTMLKGHVDDVMEDSDENITAMLSEWSELFLERIERNRDRLDNDYLAEQVMGNEKYLSELNIIDENGIVIYSSDPAYVGFDMHSGKQSEAFLCLLSGTDYYAQEVPEAISFDNDVIRMYAGRPFYDGSGFIQMGLSQENLDTIVYEDLEDEVMRRHIGVEGGVMVCDADHRVIASGHDSLNGKVLDNTDILPDEEGVFKYSKKKIFGRPCYTVTVLDNDRYIIGRLPVREAAFFGLINRLMIVFMNIVIFLCMYLVLAKLLNVHMIKGIEQIGDSVEKITGGDLDEKLNVKTSLEFKKLSGGINAMVDRLKSMIDQEKARIDKELKDARTIQASSLPSVFPPFPNRKEFKIYAVMDPAKVVGGDFYDFFMMDDDHLSLVVADVSGKGIPAALFMMSAKQIIRSMSHLETEPSKILLRANAALAEDNKEKMFVTVWLGILEISTGKLTYASAGHTRMALYQDAAWQYTKKAPNGVALGMFDPKQLAGAPEKYRVIDRSVILKSGDAIFQYTDGVTEATDRDMKLFGEERLLEALNEAQDTDPEKLLPYVRSRIDSFVEDEPQFDDITMLGIFYIG